MNHLVSEPEKQSQWLKGEGHLIATDIAIAVPTDSLNSEDRMLSKIHQPTPTRFTISARGKTAQHPLDLFLADYFPAVPLSSMDSIFGFVERSTLYGGRPFSAPELSDSDVTMLAAWGIGLRLPLTNKFVSEAEYQANWTLLERHHRAGNAVILYDDDLARWIRRDFPLFTIEASVTKELRTHEKITRARELYDQIVLPATLNDDIEFLTAIEDKSAITLFANAGCAYNCPSRICYTYVSNMNKFDGAEFRCSKQIVPRDELGMVDFDLSRLRDLGFTRFKLLRSMGITAF